MFRWMKRFFLKRDSGKIRKVAELEEIEELVELDLNDTQFLKVVETSKGLRRKIKAVSDVLEVRIREKENPAVTG